LNVSQYQEGWSRWHHHNSHHIGGYVINNLFLFSSAPRLGHRLGCLGSSACCISSVSGLVLFVVLGAFFKGHLGPLFRGNKRDPRALTTSMAASSEASTPISFSVTAWGSLICVVEMTCLYYSSPDHSQSSYSYRPVGLAVTSYRKIPGSHPGWVS
jgi:hypothetical protein